MKQAKKLASLLLALVMVLALATTAFAATVNVPADSIITGHAFTAYQVFKGDYSDGVLSNVGWGTGINSTNFLAALKNDTTYGSKFTSFDDAAKVAKVLSDDAANTALANRFAELAYANKTTGTPLNNGANELADGYYLIVDTTESLGDNSALNKALLQVVGNNTTYTIAVKTDAPSVEKKVKEDNYLNDGGYGAGYNDVADYEIGEYVPFLLIGRVPDMSRYDTYKYTFTDALSAGLTAPEETGIKVYLSNDKKVDDGDTPLASGYNVLVSGQTITVSFANLKSISGIVKDKYIIVEYSAQLNASAQIGLPGNPNTVKLTYSSDPNQSGSGDTNPTKETPEDKVIVFTYELDTTKVDDSNHDTKLKDAKFVLLNSDKTKVATVKNNKLTGWISMPTANTDGSITWPANTTLTSDVNGLFKVAGLDNGTYYLRETVAPRGYNLLSADVEVVITATTGNVQNWDGTAKTALTNLTVTADSEPGTGAVDTGIAGIKIANNKGSTLPNTGGIGTTIFYVLGSILVIGAAVLLVTKKRMGAKD